jgi:hypothetical protein
LKRVMASLINVPKSLVCACGRVSGRLRLSGELTGVTGAGCGDGGMLDAGSSTAAAGRGGAVPACQRCQCWVQNAARIASSAAEAGT